MAYNLTGSPAAVVPSGTSLEGVPIGVQTRRTAVALAVARYVKTAFGRCQPPQATIACQVA
jgi:Asp-tRNA(Asn)/Glu-tRNA(Gln) amidotransferase A subunit family amidase